MSSRQIVLIAHDVRSTHNVGSLLRTADGLAIDKVYFTGYTPYPAAKDDVRLPHLSAKLNAQISKTSLGAEATVDWEHADQLNPLIARLKSERYEIVAIEQTPNASNLKDFKRPERVALIVGNEVKGLDAEVIKLCSEVIEIPMLGAKESLNVSVAAAIALHYLRMLA